jgi:exonuclease SbcC
MKILQLTLAGFGPFRQEQRVDFRVCNDAGLFMVAGTTGSGKTTLLDAISFALYGETTGEGQGTAEADGRKAMDVRCLSCQPDEPTFVTLEFEAGGERWRITRSPAYLRAAKRGGGTVNEAAEAKIERRGAGDWDPVESVRTIGQVNEYVRKITGLQAEQFRRVIVIPQGRFREVLLSPPSERQELLKRIFGTHLYERFTEMVKDAEREARIQVEHLRSERAALLREEVWSTGLDALSILDKARETLRAATSEDSSVKERLKLLDEQVSKAEQELVAAKEGNAKVDQRERHRQSLAEWNGKLQGLDSLRKELAEARRVQDAARRIDEAAGAEKDLAIKTRGVTDAESELKPLKESFAAATTDFEAASRTRDSDAGHLQAELGSLETHLRQVEKNASALRNLRTQESRSRSEHASAVVASGRNRTKAEAAAAARNDADRLFRSARESLQRNRAGILAQELRPDCACPVCGSLEHPHPATLEDESIDDARIESLDRDLSAKTESLKQAERDERESRLKEQEISGSIELLLKEIAALGEDPDGQIRESKSKAEAIRSRLQAIETAYRNAEGQKKLAEGDLTRVRNELQRLIGVREAATSNLEQARAARDAAMAVVGDIGEDGVRSAARPVDWQEDAEKKLNAAELGAQKAKGALEASEAAALGLQRADLIALEGRLEEARDRRKATREEDRRVASILARYKKLVSDLESLAVRESEASARHRPSNELAQLVIGASGETRISLHAWVLGAYLDEVLSVASERLKDLTVGRYELRRMASRLDGRSEAGLNIEVFDSHTGSSRPARTLSGGETFLASLSMALALAEVAAARGGKTLDTVFIDEGFGTLDSETLDVAMGVLTRLREAGRTVGLISHVEEMKRRIPNGIEVRKDPRTGTSRVVCT